MPEKRRGLGRGLGALIPSSAEPEQNGNPNTRSGDMGRPVDLFFPAGGANAAEAGSAEQDGLASTNRSRSRSAINKEALTAPSRRAGTRPQASKRVASPASRQGPASGAPESPVESTEESAPATQPRDRASEEARVGEVEDAAPRADLSVEPQAEAAGEALDDVTVEDVSRETLREVPGARFAELPIGSIHPNRKQPRTVFDEDELAELVHSVREIGVLQPIVVRPSTEGGEQAYELVMGERRWRATKEAGLDFVPAIIRDTTDDDLLRDALLENLHRSQLNPLEEAAAYQQLLDDFGCSQEELAARIGRSRPQITNTLRLMKLPPLVQRRLAAGVISAGHARALLGLADPAEMEKLAQRIVAEGLSVRSTEEIVAMSDGLRRPSKSATPRSAARHERLDYLATSLSDRLDTSVKITLGAKKGRVSIEFASVDDLNRIMGVLNPSQS